MQLDGAIGAQRPRFLVVPSAATSAGDEAADLAESAGLVLDEWQRFALDVACGEGADGKWAAFQVALIVPRQNGKGSVLEAVELAGLFLWGEQLILHSAHEFKTAREAFRRVCALVENNDWLRKRCKKPRTSHGEEGIELLNGNRLNFVARSTGSGRGFAGDRVILDEAYALTEDHMAALLPTMSARSVSGNPQIWYTSSAPRDASAVLHDIRRKGRLGEPGMAFLEWSAPDDAQSDDRTMWSLANPGLGIRIAERFVAETELGYLSDTEFRRERLGIAPDILSERLIPLEDWLACTSPNHAPTGEVVFGVDVSPEREKGHSAIVACDESGTIEVIDARPGVAWLSAKVIELGIRHRTTVTVDSASPAHSFADEWERAGCTVQRLTSREMAGACGTFYDAVLTHNVKIRTDPAIDKAAAGARKRESGDVWYWARRDNTVDVSPLVAASIARWAAIGPSTYENRGMTVFG